MIPIEILFWVFGLAGFWPSMLVWWARKRLRDGPVHPTEDYAIFMRDSVLCGVVMSITVGLMWLVSPIVFCIALGIYSLSSIVGYFSL